MAPPCGYNQTQASKTFNIYQWIQQCHAAHMNETFNKIYWNIKWKITLNYATDMVPNEDLLPPLKPYSLCSVWAQSGCSIWAVPDPDTCNGDEADGDETNVQVEEQTVNNDPDHLPFLWAVAPLEVLVHLESDDHKVSAHLPQFFQDGIWWGAEGWTGFDWRCVIRDALRFSYWDVAVVGVDCWVCHKPKTACLNSDTSEFTFYLTFFPKYSSISVQLKVSCLQQYCWYTSSWWVEDDCDSVFLLMSDTNENSQIF